MTLSRGLMLVVTMIMILLVARIQPTSAQGTTSERIAVQEQRIYNHEQMLIRMEARMSVLEHQISASATALAEQRAIMLTAGTIFAFLLGGQLIVTLRKKPQ